jgi:hypothetical protein
MEEDRWGWVRLGDFFEIGWEFLGGGVGGWCMDFFLGVGRVLVCGSVVIDSLNRSNRG